MVVFRSVSENMGSEEFKLENTLKMLLSLGEQINKVIIGQGSGAQEIGKILWYV